MNLQLHSFKIDNLIVLSSFIKFIILFPKKTCLNHFPLENLLIINLLVIHFSNILFVFKNDLFVHLIFDFLIFVRSNRFIILIFIINFTYLYIPQKLII